MLRLVLILVQVKMLLQSSASSSVEASISFASNHANTWQNCSECGGISKDESELLTASNMCVNSGQNLLSKRRKVQRNSVIVFPGQPDTGCNKQLSSDNNPLTKPETEVVDEDLSIREICFSVLKSYGRNAAGGVCSVRSSASAEDLRTCRERSVESCKLCGNSDDTQNMLLCDHCDEAFHASCCNPKIKTLPIDNWFCYRCSKFKDAASRENSSLKLPGIGGWRNGISRFEMGPIALMLKYPEPYRSRVRIGQAFQAEVPDWPDRISSDADSIGEPLELEPAKVVPSAVRRKFPKLSYMSNWLQCREILYNDKRECTEGTICGKWRRAPLFSVQTDNWDCSCAVLWDPTHSDCAVPQECDTDEVLSHLAYVELLRADIATRRKTNLKWHL